MRVNVLVAIAVATFVASCSSFVGAKTAPLDDFAINIKKMDRRLGMDSDVHEERGGTLSSTVVEDVLGYIKKPIDGIDQAPKAQVQNLNQLANEQLRAKQIIEEPGPSKREPRIQLSTATDEKVKPRDVEVSEDLEGLDEPLPDYKKFYMSLSEDDIKILLKSKIDLAKLQKGEEDQIRLLLKYAVKGSEKKRSFFTKMVIYTIYAMGIMSFIGMIYFFITRAPKGDPYSSELYHR